MSSKSTKKRFVVVDSYNELWSETSDLVFNSIQEAADHIEEAGLLGADGLSGLGIAELVRVAEIEVESVVKVIVTAVTKI